MAWFGCALLFVLLCTASNAINANLPSVGHYDSQAMWSVIVGSVLFCALWLVHLVRHFYHGPESLISSQPNAQS